MRGEKRVMGKREKPFFHFLFLPPHFSPLRL